MSATGDDLTGIPQMTWTVVSATPLPVEMVAVYDDPERETRFLARRCVALLVQRGTLFMDDDYMETRTVYGVQRLGEVIPAGDYLYGLAGVMPRDEWQTWATRNPGLTAWDGDLST